METITTGVFSKRSQAENAITELHSDLGVPLENISFLYQNIQNEEVEIKADDASIPPVEKQSVGEAAVTGVVAGGSIGALAGIATVAGLIPVVGPIFAAGPLLAGLGIGAGLVGTATATGAAAGGLIGVLTGWGVPEDKAAEYEGRVGSGDILVTVQADHHIDIADIFTSNGALYVDSYSK